MSSTGRLGRRGDLEPGWLREPFGIAGSVMAIVGLGALTVVEPPLALVLAGATAIAGVLVRVARVPMPAIVVLGALAVISLVDLPRRFVVGPTTFYAWITAALALLLVALSASRYVLVALRGAGRLFFPLYAFAGWALLSMAWFRLSFAGVQNTLVYASFAALIPVTTAVVVRGDVSLALARRAVTLALVLASALYLGSLALGGLGGADIVSSRSYALVGVVGVAWGAAHARYGDRRMLLLAGASWLLILLSLSRLAFGAAVLILVVASLDLSSPSRLFKSALIVGSVAAVAFYAITSFGPMAERFSQGDVQRLGGGVAVNVEGRAQLWHVTWRSYLESPIVGKGAGSAEATIRRVLDEEDHPHNDYLRILHDFGFVGFALLISSFIGLLIHSTRRLRAADRNEAPLHYAAVLSLLGLMVGMATDNAIVYLFVVVPIGVIVGLSIGADLLRTSARLRTVNPTSGFA